MDLIDILATDSHFYGAYTKDVANDAAGVTLHCLDVACPGQDALEPKPKRQIVPVDQIQQWLENPPSSRTHRSSEPVLPGGPSLRIISIHDPQRNAEFAMRQPSLPLGRDVIENIISHFEISHHFIVAALNQDTVWFKVRFSISYQTCCKELTVQEHCDTRKHQEDLEQVFKYVFRTYSTPYGHFVLGLTYRPKEMSTTALVAGLVLEEIEELYSLLDRCRESCAAPLLVPSLLARLTWKYVNNRAHLCHEIANKVREQMGLHPNLKTTMAVPQPAVDMVELSRELTRLFEKLAKYRQHTAALFNLLQFLDDACQSCLNATMHADVAKVAEATAAIRTMIAYVTSSTRSLTHWTQYLQHRAEGYGQTAYSLIAQRDNALSMQMALGSLRIAESSRADNLTMKAIAEDSRTIAIEGLQKSKTMRTIAVVTVLFLPATFVATLFSMDFFDFHAVGGPVVSSWIWIYALVTVVLTLAVQSIWFFSKRSSRSLSCESNEPVF